MYPSKRRAALGVISVLGFGLLQACGGQAANTAGSDTTTDSSTSFPSGSNSPTTGSGMLSPNTTGGDSFSAVSVPSSTETTGTSVAQAISSSASTNDTRPGATNDTSTPAPGGSSDSEAAPHTTGTSGSEESGDNPGSDVDTAPSDATDDTTNTSDEPDTSDESDETSSGDAGDESSSGGEASAETSVSEAPEPEGNLTLGQGGVVNATIVVRAGEIFDGGGKTYTAGSALGDGSQDEDQLPVFRLEDGAQIRNVTIGSPAADGIHCYGNVTLNDITWADIGEDALTIKESGTVVLDGGSAQNGDDKVFQINAASTFIVRNFTARNAGKFIRQNGDTTFKVDVVIENCDISSMDECVFRTDSSSSTVTMRNSRYSDLGDGLFIGVNENNITLSNNEEY
jgi:pectate lyase C